MNIPIEESREDKVRQGINHAKDGYRNAQDVVRFIDTKAAALIGLSTLIFGFYLAGIGWFAETPSQLADILINHGWAALSCFATFFSSILCLVFCLLTLISRKPIVGGMTFLFPFAPKGKEQEALDTYRELHDGITQSKIAEQLTYQRYR